MNRRRNRALEIQNLQDLTAVDLDLVRRAVKAAAGDGSEGISLSIVDNAAIERVNKEYLGRDGPTDVIAFDYGEKGDSVSVGAGEDVSGEVIVSAEEALKAARELGRDLLSELVLYIVHGVLHLRGYDDRSGEKREIMQKRESEILREMGLEDPWTEREGCDQETPAPAVRIYTDGACRGNPGPGGWGIRVLYPDGRVLEKGGAEEDTTNNRMELRAAIEALRLSSVEPSVVVVTDSEYVRLGITEWISGWKDRGWKTVKKSSVRNSDLWKELDALLGSRVEWEYVEGHAGDPDNERCDRIAVAFAKGKHISLADGTVCEEPPAPRPGSTKKRSKKRKNRKGGYYVSLVGGKVERHETWTECEARVKGVSRALFKKCFDEIEEREILAKWGVGPL